MTASAETTSDAAAHEGACAFCGLPIPGASWFPGPTSRPEPAGPQFCCYGCQFASAVTAERGETGAIRWTLTRLGLAIFFTMNLMVFTMALWSIDVYDGAGGTETDAALENALFGLFRWLCLLLSLPVLLLLGLPILQHAWENLRSGRLSTDLLILCGVAAAYAVSIASVLSGSGPIYFEVAALVLVMVTLGRWFEATGRHKATESMEQLERLLPTAVCRLKKNGAETTVPLDEVKPGDRLRVRAGERFPTDGRLVSPRASVDRQVFTGESVPVEQTAGDAVSAGTLNLDGDAVIVATARPYEGSFARLVELLRRARLTRGRYQRLADRVTAWFFPSVTAIAALVFAVHLQTSLEAGLLASLSVVLIACPCSLGLATPLAVWSALGRAAKHQVLFRNGAALERLGSVRAVRFDKTGTLTTGDPLVREFCSPAPAGDGWVVLGLAQTLAASSKHPFSRAVARFASAGQDLDDLDAPADVSEIRTVAGRGIEGRLADDSGLVRIGRVDFVQPNADAPLPAQLSAELAAAEDHGWPVVAIGRGGRVEGLFVLDEQLRPETESALEECRALRLDVAVLTGDRPERARWLAELNAESKNDPLTVLSGLTPEDKVGAVRDAQIKLGPTAMIGDGINDAPALAASDVGIALGCGADVSRDSASVCLLGDDSGRVPWAIRLARRTRGTIRRNLFWAFLYNTVGIGIAATGSLNPAVAACLMIGSSVLVISNSLRLAADDDPPTGGSAPRLVPSPEQTAPQREAREPDLVSTGST